MLTLVKRAWKFARFLVQFGAVKREEAGKVMKTAMLTSAIVGSLVFVSLAAFVILAQRQGYGIELQTIGVCLVSGVLSLLSLGVWLFIKAK